MAHQPKDALAEICERVEQMLAKRLNDINDLTVIDLQLYLSIKTLDALQECNRRLEHLEIQSALAAAYLGGLLEIDKEDAKKASLTVQTMVREYHHPSPPPEQRNGSEEMHG